MTYACLLLYKNDDKTRSHKCEPSAFPVIYHFFDFSFFLSLLLLFDTELEIRTALLRNLVCMKIF